MRLKPSVSRPWHRGAVLLHGGVTNPHCDIVIAGPRRCLTLSMWPMNGSEAAKATQPYWFMNWPHRRRYLHYSGPIDGGRGWVRQLWSGALRVRRVGNGWHLFFASGSQRQTIQLIDAQRVQEHQPNSVHHEWDEVTVQHWWQGVAGNL